MDPLSIAASGMRAAELRMATSAHNIANLRTPAFQRLDVHQSALEGGGVSARVVRSEIAEEPDLLREYLAQFEPPLEFAASARVFETAAEMSGTLVDLLA